MFVRCPFCHKLILRWLYERHHRDHMRLRADGQHKDHVTNAPDDRYRGSLDEVPQVYRHTPCDGRTRMPEEIIRSYLVNPLLYNDRTFCTGCQDYVDTAELFWTTTGENLMDYSGRLFAANTSSGFSASPRRLSENRSWLSRRRPNKRSAGSQRSGISRSPTASC